MALINRTGKFLRGIIKKYLVDIPDLTPEQKLKVRGAMEKLAVYVADTVAKAASEAAEGAARGAVQEIKK
jgi:hypothetical protein